MEWNGSDDGIVYDLLVFLSMMSRPIAQEKESWHSLAEKIHSIEIYSPVRLRSSLCVRLKMDH